MTDSSPQLGLGAHSHVGGKTVPLSAFPSHLHPVGSRNIDDHPVPTSKTETWRFTPLRRLRDLHADAAFSPHILHTHWETTQNLPFAELRGDEAMQLRGVSGYLPTERFAARVLADAPTTVLLDVPADTTVDQPVIVRISADDKDSPTAGHTVIRIGAHSQVTVIVEYSGSVTAADVVEIMTGDGANANIVVLTDWDSDAVQLAHHHIAPGRDSYVKHSVLTFGGETVRISTSVDYQGPGGEVELLGLYFADAGQYLEHRLAVEHREPHCTSQVLYKGALQGQRARVAWVGDVLIRKSAEGTDSYETNRNLLLTAGARADSVPNLEIETGEIKRAAHASATGRFDDEHMFYLQSRGIDPETAKRLVVRGFFHEVLHKVNVPAIEDRIAQMVERELSISGQ